MNNGDHHKLLEIRFVNLVSALTVSAMQQLGKLVNPLSGKTEINLEAARVSIDLLEMLREKTKGNLNEDEVNLLRSTLSNLQLNYVDEAAKKKTQTQEPEEKEKSQKKDTTELKKESIN